MPTSGSSPTKRPNSAAPSRFWEDSRKFDRLRCDLRGDCGSGRHFIPSGKEAQNRAFLGEIGKNTVSHCNFKGLEKLDSVRFSLPPPKNTANQTVGSIRNVELTSACDVVGIGAVQPCDSIRALDLSPVKESRTNSVKLLTGAWIFSKTSHATLYSCSFPMRYHFSSDYIVIVE